MKTKKRLIIGLFCAMIVSLCSFGITACQEPEFVDQGETGIYYFDAGESEYIVTLTEGNFSFLSGETTKSGAYTYDGTNFSVLFDGDEEATVATLANDMITITIDGQEYTFLKKKYFSVNYEVDGGSAVATQTIINGKTASQPEAPTKEGYAFIGWYADAEFTSYFDFDQKITENTTVYARFEAYVVGKSEFTATYFVDGEKYWTQQTVGGMLYGMPTPAKEGAEFAGWWYSDYQSADKLTAQYDGAALTQNTNLYAVWKSSSPIVSVTKTGVNITASGTNNSYAIAITDPNGEVKSQTVGSSIFSYDFANAVAGDYEISVTLNGNTTYAYYNNKVLDRVSLFSVASPATLMFNSVANAQEYYITVDCGNDEHVHTNISLGSSLYYNFANCSMQEGGIAFTVTASANGYASSVSETYYYDRALEQITNVVVDAEAETITWDKVANAASYVVVVTCGGTETEINVGAANSFSFKEFGGNLTLGVYPVAKGYNSPEAYEVEYNKTTLATPANVVVNNKTITWDAVDGATSYNVKIGAQVYTVQTNSFTLTEEQYVEGQEVYEVSVQAVGATVSLYTDVAEVRFATMSAVSYNAGVISWDYVVSAASYAVKVNGGAAQVVSAENNSFAVTLTKKGVNTISVCFYDADGVASNWVEIEVTAYAINFDTQGGEEIESVYFAFGDKINLPQSTYAGYDFAGWYNVPAGPENNGAKFEDEYYQNAGDITLFAYWTAAQYTINLEVVNAKNEVTATYQAKVTYKKDFTLLSDVANDDLTKIFNGWYTEKNGRGYRYADSTGASTQVWDIIPNEGETITLYAGMVSAYTFRNYKHDGTEGWIITKNTAVDETAYDKVEVLEVPTEYEGKPVLAINAEAFKSAGALRQVLIPDTIQNIVFGVNGGNGTGSPFYLASKMESVEVFAVQGNHEVKYASVDGVLFYNNTTTKKVDLVYFPIAKTGSYEIPSSINFARTGDVEVSSLPTKVFANAKIEKITIPSSITSISDSAFYYCSSLLNIEFEEVEDGEEAKPLTFGSQVFYYNSKIEEITLPSRSVLVDENGYFVAYSGTGGKNIFQGCSKLLKVNVSGTEGNYSSIDGIVTTVDKTEIIYCPVGRVGSYTIPQGVNIVGKLAFYNCTKLTEVIIPAYVHTIKESAFEGCTGITSLKFEGEANDSPLNIKAKAFYKLTTLETVTLPENTGTVETQAFGYTTKLLTVYVNGGANMVLQQAAFGYKTSESTAAYTFKVTTLYLGPNVPVFGVGGVFGEYLTSITVDPANTNFKSENGVLFNSDQTTLIYYPSVDGEYTIPESVISIDDGAFKRRTGLTKVTIGKNVERVGIETFAYCSYLTEVIFTDGGSKDLVIDNSAFASCTRLVVVELPVRLKSIGEHAFQSCTQMVNLVIPEGVTTIGDYAFYSCSKLASISFPASLETMGEYDASGNLIGTNVFYNCNALQTITVASGNKNFATRDNILYSAVEGVATELIFASASVAGEIVIPNTVTKVWNRAFYQNDFITKVTFEESPTDLELEVGEYAFGYMQAAEQIIFRGGLKTIGKYCFYYSNKLEYVFVPNTVELLGNNAFYYCSGLKEIEFEEADEDNVIPLVFENTGSNGTASSSYAPIANLASLEKLILPERTTVLPKYFVYNCLKLREIYIPAVTSMGDYTFYYCPGIEKITFSEDFSLTTLPMYFVYAYTSTTNAKYGTLSITIPDSIETISNYAFYYCGMEEIVIPKNVKAIGNNAFYNFKLKNLTKVTFAEDSQLETIGDSAFRYGAFAEFELPASVISVGTYAFANNTNLTSFSFAENSKIASIGNYAFQGTGITEINFPETGDSLTLGTNMFSGCRYLETVYIPKAVTSVDNVFTGCGSIKNFIIAENHPNFAIDEKGELLTNVKGDSIKFAVTEINAAEGVYAIADGVLDIGQYAFQGQTGIKKLIIPKSVKTIGNYAFQYCANIEEIVVEEGSALQSIGNYAFRYCYSLKSVDLSNCTSLKASSPLGTNLFAYCYDLETVKLPEGIKALNTCMFQYCESLKEITLPSTLTTISQQAFQYTGLENVVVPEGVTTIGNNAFGYCDQLKSIKFPSTLNITSATAGTYMVANCPMLTSVEFGNGDGIKHITNYMFQNDTALQSITIPSTVTSIGTYAFKATSIKSITIPEYVASIGTNAFQDCVNLEEVNFSADNKITTFSNYLFDGCSALKEITIPENVTFIGTYVFRNCTSLESIVIPEAVTLFSTTATTKPTASTAVYTFDGCANLKTVTLHENFTAIPAYTFRNCTSLATINYATKDGIVGEEGKVTLPTSLGVLGNYALSGTAIDSIDISGVGTLGTYLFQNCVNLKEAIVHGDKTTLVNYMFYGCSSFDTLKYYDGKEVFGESGEITFSPKLTAIPIAMFRGTAVKEVTIPNTIKTLNTYIFTDCANLETVTFESGITVTSIANYMFQNCVSLKNVNIPEKVTSLGTYSFDGTSSLEQIVLPASLTTINTYVFRNSGLTSIVIPKNVSSIGNYAFGGCANLTMFEVDSANGTFVSIDGALYTDGGATLKIYPSGLGGNNGVLELDPSVALSSYAFYGNTKIEKLIVPGEITVFPTYAFSSMTALKTVEFGDGAEALNNYMFSDCVALENVTLPETLTALPTYLFRNCTALKTVNIPSAVTALSTGLFYNAGISEIKLSDNITAIDTYVFYGTVNLKSIEIPASVTIIGAASDTTTTSYTFTGSGITSITIPATVQQIKGYVFQNCLSLETVNWLTTAAIPNYAFNGCEKLKTVTMVEGMDAFGTYVFQNCVSLESIEIPKSVIDIGNYAFKGSGLKNVVVYEGVETIGTYAFQDCLNLESVEIKGEITIVQTSLFNGCVNLKEVILPDSVTTIYANAFTNCTSLKKLIIPESVGTLNGNAFVGWTEDQTLYLRPRQYEVATSWAYNWNKDCHANLVWGYTGD